MPSIHAVRTARVDGERAAADEDRPNAVLPRGGDVDDGGFEFRDERTRALRERDGVFEPRGVIARQGRATELIVAIEGAEVPASMEVTLTVLGPGPIKTPVT